MNYLTACIIVKNELLYLDEWIAFHMTHGVEHFFMYENESTDGTWESLKAYEKLGIATIEKIPTDPTNTQRVAYNKCLKEHGHKTKWMAFLDCDEFLYSPKGKVDKLLKSYEEYGAVAVNWVLYGSNGHTEYFPEPVTNRFTKRAAKADRHVKSIVQPEFTISAGNNAHYFKLSKPAVNEKKEVLPAVYYHTEPTIDVFRINHYHVKSLEEYVKRKSYRDVDGVNRGELEGRFRAHDVNEVEDTSACFINKI